MIVDVQVIIKYSTSTMNTAKCPICNSDVIVDDEACEGELVNCANCGADLKIVSLRPVRLRELPAEEMSDANPNEAEEQE